jgi:hypothetical protein
MDNPETSATLDTQKYPIGINLFENQLLEHLASFV